MPKHSHEFRDPIHNFITVSLDEREVIDSPPFQRLRYIHQLALTYLVYPGATHRRFEHSLGVMELAGRVFDVLIRSKRHKAVDEHFPSVDKLTYWREVVRMGALCHDLGHMPLSHAAEGLMAGGYHHENLSIDIIRDASMRPLWDAFPLRPDDVAKVAAGPSKWPGGASEYSQWDKLMTDIVTDAFGVDRIDYLLRDSLHAGVAYGRFDHYRLIDTLRILPSPVDESPVIGIEAGGIHAAEALQQARYFMFSQLYLHRVRRAYDLHLRDFLSAWLPGGHYSTDLGKHVGMTDNEVLTAIHSAARDTSAPGHEPARRIVKREHYQVLYSRRAEDLRMSLEPEKAIFEAATKEFGDAVRLDGYRQESQSIDFAVIRDDGSVVSSLQESEILNRIPGAAAGYVFVTPEREEEARKWLAENHAAILGQRREEEQ